MADEKILKDEILKDEELDQVAGGTLGQTANDMYKFSVFTGVQFSGNDDQQRDQFRKLLFSCGVKIKDHGGIDKNEYYLLNPQGQKIQKLDEEQAINIAINNFRIGYRIC